MDKTTNCILCGKELKIKPKGWAKKYCSECRKIDDRERAKRYEEKNKEKNKQRRLELKENPRPEFIICENCGVSIKNTCWNKKYCDDCKKVMHTKVSQIWTANNPEKAKEIQARRDPEKIREGQREFRNKNREFVRKRDRGRYPKESEHRKKQAREYHKLYPDQIRATKRKYRASEHGRFKCQEHGRKRRARKNQAIHLFTMEEWKLKLEQTKGFCPICNKFIGVSNLVLDHNPPLSKVPEGFVYTINEVEPLCSSCNSKKSNKLDRATAMKLYEYKKALEESS